MRPASWRTMALSQHGNGKMRSRKRSELRTLSQRFFLQISTRATGPTKKWASPLEAASRHPAAFRPRSLWLYCKSIRAIQITQVPYSTIAQDLLKILARHGRTSLAFGRAIVERLENSWSWDSAKSSMSLLDQPAVLDEDLLQRIETAIQNNGEVGWRLGECPTLNRSHTVQRHRHVGSD